MLFAQTDTERGILKIYILISALMLSATFIVSSGLFIIDEFVLLSGVRAFQEHGNFVVSNGIEGYFSEDLKLWLLKLGPSGLVPQYPPGSAILGAPLNAIFGQRGLMLINVAAGILILPVIWHMTKEHLGGNKCALLAILLLALGTFWLEYVYAVWPHSVSLLGVTFAFSMTLSYVQDDQVFFRRGLLAGAAIGAALLFRTDSILALPAIGLSVFLFADRPIRFVSAVALGTLPFLAVNSHVNLQKFGTLNPLSYGNSGSSGTGLLGHLPAIAGIGLVAVGLLIASHFKWKPTRKQVSGTALVAVMIVVSWSPLRDLGLRYLTGAWALLIDSTIIQDPRPGVVHQADGTVSFWGLWKKALGQSMPWLGILVLGFHLKSNEQRAGFGSFLLVVAIMWSLPFFIRSWHGGMGSNMRYLIPLIPLLCAYCARLLLDFSSVVTDARDWLLRGSAVGFVVVMGWMLLHPTGPGGAQQIVSTFLLFVVAGLCLAAAIEWQSQQVLQKLAMASIGAAFSFSFAFLAADFTAAQKTRIVDERINILTRQIPDNSLVYAPSRFVSSWSIRRENVIALPNPYTYEIDIALIDAALDRGKRVFIWPGYAAEGLPQNFSQRMLRHELGGTETFLWEVLPE